jgi:hypothetical protein
MSRRKLAADQKLILWLIGVMAVLILGIIVLQPKQEAENETPASDNAGPLGVKAAYLTLEGLGHPVSRWQQSLAELNGSMSDAQAARTTLVLLEPKYDATEEADLRKELSRFIGRGGHLLITGGLGARMLGAATGSPELLQALCHTVPQGESALARTGKMEITDRGGWKVDDKAKAGLLAENATVQVAQQCGRDTVVVELKAGAGRAVWWTAETPMTNAELKRDPGLKLLLASVDGDQYSGDGAPRSIVFDEAMHQATRTKWTVTKGLPILWVSLQTAALCLLLLFSFSRRRGPIRTAVELPRSSPVEFATSMGDLYEKGEATSAVTEAARRRLLRALVQGAGLASETVAAGPDAIQEALVHRLGINARPLAEDIAEHLREANEAREAKVSAKSALKLAQAFSEDVERLSAAIMPAAEREFEAERR